MLIVLMKNVSYIINLRLKLLLKNVKAFLKLEKIKDFLAHTKHDVEIFVKYIKKRNKIFLFNIIMNQELINNIKIWINNDNQIKELQKKIKLLREDKKKCTIKLVNMMKENDIDAFDINDGKLLYTKTEIKTPISKKHLLTSVSEYFKGDKQTIENLCNFILDTRKTKTTENIKRKIKK